MYRLTAFFFLTMEIFTIYTITLEDKVMYVGCTKDFENRKRQHLSKKNSSAIPSDVDVNDVTFSVIEEYDNKDKALQAEDKNIIKYGTIKHGWNKERSGLITRDTRLYQNNWEDDNREERNIQKRKWDTEYRNEHREEFNAHRRATRDYRAERLKRLEKQRKSLAKSN